jgi:hypothetical protein
MTRACVHMYLESDDDGNDKEKQVLMDCALKSKDRVSMDSARRLDAVMVSGLLGSAAVDNVRQENKVLKNEVLRPKVSSKGSNWTYRTL